MSDILHRVGSAADNDGSLARTQANWGTNSNEYKDGKRGVLEDMKLSQPSHRNNSTHEQGNTTRITERPTDGMRSCKIGVASTTVLPGGNSPFQGVVEVDDALVSVRGFFAGTTGSGSTRDRAPAEAFALLAFALALGPMSPFCWAGVKHARPLRNATRDPTTTTQPCRMNGPGCMRYGSTPHKTHMCSRTESGL